MADERPELDPLERLAARNVLGTVARPSSGGQSFAPPVDVVREGEQVRVVTQDQALQDTEAGFMLWRDEADKLSEILGRFARSPRFEDRDAEEIAADEAAAAELTTAEYFMSRTVLGTVGRCVSEGNSSGRFYSPVDVVDEGRLARLITQAELYDQGREAGFTVSRPQARELSDLLRDFALSPRVAASPTIEA